MTVKRKFSLEANHINDKQQDTGQTTAQKYDFVAGQMDKTGGNAAGAAQNQRDNIGEIVWIHRGKAFLWELIEKNVAKYNRVGYKGNYEKIYIENIQ